MEQRPVGYQLYSARAEAEKNLDAVLGELKAMGYDGVEFAGLYGHTAAEIRALLNKHGLKGISAHVPLAAIEADMDGVLAAYKEIGCEYIAVPYLDDQTRPGTARFASVLRTIYLFGQKCKAADVGLLYHNHDFEFVTISNQYGLDFIYDAVPAELLQAEPDVCWIKYAGLDPVDYVKKYAGRVPIVHLKDYVGQKSDQPPYALIGIETPAPQSDIPFRFTPFGHGSQDASAVVNAGIEAGARWFIVEQDASVERPPLEAARMSIETLKKIGLKA